MVIICICTTKIIVRIYLPPLKLNFIFYLNFYNIFISNIIKVGAFFFFIYFKIKFVFLKKI